MAIEFDVADLIARRGVNDSQRAAAIAHINTAGGSIVTHVIRIVRKFYRFDTVERRSIEYIASAAVRVRNEQFVKLGGKSNPLGFMESGQTTPLLAGARIQISDGVVPECRDE